MSPSIPAVPRDSNGHTTIHRPPLFRKLVGLAYLLKHDDIGLISSSQC